MKKTRRLFFVTSLFSLSALFLAGTVLADNGPHGDYDAATDACAGCHRAHTAVGPRLLIESSTYNLCMSCHGTAGTGADTNVEDGVYLDLDSADEDPDEGYYTGLPGDLRGLKAGGFVNALMDTDWDGAATSTATSSNHMADGNLGTAWGNGAIGSGPGATAFSLSCTSCHDPHGGAAGDGGPTYRILRNTPLNSGGGGHDVPDEGDKLYTVSDLDNRYFGEGYSSGGTWAGMDLQEDELSEWCTQCHTRYLAPADSGHDDSTDPIFAYRHMAGDAADSCFDFCHIAGPGWPHNLRTTSGPMWNHTVECMTCHVAHGSSASMGGYANSVEWPDGAVTPSGDERSSLLRVDGRGTCQLCHGK